MLNVMLRIIKCVRNNAVLVVELRLGWGKRLLAARDSAVAGGGGAGEQPDARPTGPICYAFLLSRATRYNSDFPSFPWFGII
jgi:hypothetical protein